MRYHKTLTVAAAALLLSVSLTVTDEAPAVPEGAVEHAGHHYKLFDDVEDLSWNRGKAHCAEMGGHLAVVTSSEEAAFVATLCDGAYAFLGASDDAEEGTWVWVDGTPWEFTWWMDGQPNNYGGVEDYLATYKKGRWVDVEASGEDFWMPTGYVCEWDY